MPIYHKTPPPSTVGNHNTAEIDYHNSEAAKVKRTREQAYFNSYDFDAIEVLPYDDEEDEDDMANGSGKISQRERERRQFKSIQTQKLQNKISQQQQQQQLTTHPHQPQHQLKTQQISNHYSSGSHFMVDNRQQHHPLHHANNKYNPSMCLQHISSIFALKANNINNKPQLPQQKHPKQQQQLNQRNVLGNVCGVGNKDIAVVVNALSHDNKHLKLSSSETSSTSLSVSSIVKEILNIDNVVDGSDIVIATSVGLAPSECVREVAGTGTRTTTTNDTKTAIHIQAGGISPCTLATATTASSTTATNTAGNGGNFLLPRAMLKYPSSTLSTQQGAAGSTTTAGTINSMPLAINAKSNNSNTNANRQQKQHQQHQQQQQQRDVHKFEPIKGNKNSMMPTSGSKTGLRIKNTSSNSSVITSLASEDIGEDKDLEENTDEQDLKLKTEEKVLTKKIHTKLSARASSHQSHYSTDKSASSGYYSSNVCSTYSLEEHIYSEPTLDLKKLRNNAKENQTPSSSPSSLAANAVTSSAATTLNTNNKLQQHLQQNSNNSGLLPNSSEASSVMRALDINRRYRLAENDTQSSSSNRNSQEFNDNLKILESSIENLDRHLKSFPGVSTQEALVSYTQNPYNPYAPVNHNEKLRSSCSYHQLPTIQESHDGIKKPTWNEDRSDDSLMDIDLDSFLLDKDQKTGIKTKQALSQKGVDNPTFMTEEQEENHYKCAKYINSCPEDAYRVESDIIAPARSSISGQSVAVSVDLYPKRYEEQLHFQNTRELLEDVRDKIRLLTQTQEAENQLSLTTTEAVKENQIPKELHSMINTLKQELELYLDRMNQHSELEIRQLCTGLVKNQHIVKMKNAFERRRSLSEAPDIYSTYEAVQDGIIMNAQGMPISVTQQITSIRCSSDPNFKMKRKSLNEVFPLAECYVESLPAQQQHSTNTTQHNKITQLQRNLSYHKPVLEQLKSSHTNHQPTEKLTTSGSGTASGGDTSEPNDKDSILDWHRKKPSIWEMYYGTNRIQQSLLGGKKNGLMVATASNSSPSTMCYPSSRPESDFTLDLPRAEQLRIKMEKEKKFRQRCRVITTFLSLVFFLLTVMVVSLVLTRGKRMFGSMI